MGKSVRLTYGSLILTMALWGGTFVAGKVAAREVLPLTAAFWRFLLAGAVLAVLCWRSREGLWPSGVSWGTWCRLVVLGASGMLAYNYFFIRGLGLTEAGRASVIVALNPCMIFLGTVIFCGERLPRRAAGGLLAALSGVLLAISRGEPWHLFQGKVGLGDVLIFGCTISWAIYALVGRSVLRELSPLKSTTWASIFGALLLLPLSFMEMGPLAFLDFGLRSWEALAFLGFLGTAVGFTLFYRGMVEIGTRRAAIFINLVPVFGLLSGWLCLGESLDWSLLAGLVLVIFGIRLIQRVD